MCSFFDLFKDEKNVQNWTLQNLTLLSLWTDKRANHFFCLKWKLKCFQLPSPRFLHAFGDIIHCSTLFTFFLDCKSLFHQYLSISSFSFFSLSFYRSLFLLSFYLTLSLSLLLYIHLSLPLSSILWIWFVFL